MEHSVKEIGTLDGANLLTMDSEIVMNITIFLREGSRALTDVIVSSDRLAARVVVVTITSNLPNMSDLTMTMDLGIKATAELAEGPTLFALGRDPGE